MGARPTRFLIAGALGAAALALVGCDSGPEQFVVQPGVAYPEAVGHRWERTSQNHVIVLDLPTPGFVVEFEGTVESFERDGSYLTVRRPRAGTMLPQVLVSHAIDTRVSLTRPVAVYARTVDATQEARGVPFQLVGEREAQVKQ